MRYTDCDFCHKKSVPINETLKIDEKNYCHACIENEFPDENSLNGKKIEKVFDSTVCSLCDKDNGEIELKKIASHPICDNCEITIKKRTFPLWVKGFLAFILFITLFSFFWNWKYYQAYNNIKESNTYLEKGNYENASKLMADASEKVPEVEELKVLSNFYGGIDLLQKDKSKEALTALNKCKGVLPADYGLDLLISNAKIGVYFDKKDYDSFLLESKNILKVDSTKSNSWAGVASAYACLYAAKNIDSFKVKSLQHLEKALKIDSLSADSKEYRNRIEHRLYTKQIIRREEFIKKYPKGWSKN